MNAIDIGLITIFILSSAVGIWRGLTKEFLSLISWIGALFAAYMLFPVAQNIARSNIQNPVMADMAAGFVMFIVFLVFFSLITHIIASYVRSSALGGIDRALGLGFGIIRAILIVCVLELALSSFVPRNQYPTTLQNAQFIPMVQRWSEQLLTLLPPKVQSFVLNQQQKFIEDYAKKDLDNRLDSVISGAVTQTLSDVKGDIDQVLQDIDTHNTASPPPPATVKPADVLDPKAATQDLAVLKIKKLSGDGAKHYAHEQKQDLDRLIETVS